MVTATKITNLSDILPRLLQLKLREWDRRELRASMLCDDEQDGLVWSCMSSQDLWVYCEGETVIAISGLSPLPAPTKIGVPWVLGSDRVYERPFALVKLAKKFMAFAEAKYETLVNYVGVGNTKAIKLLEWLGFEVDRSNEFLLYDPTTPFYRFYKGGGGYNV